MSLRPRLLNGPNEPKAWLPCASSQRYVVISFLPGLWQTLACLSAHWLCLLFFHKVQVSTRNGSFFMTSFAHLSLSLISSRWSQSSHSPACFGGQKSRLNEQDISTKICCFKLKQKLDALETEFRRCMDTPFSPPQCRTGGNSFPCCVLLLVCNIFSFLIGLKMWRRRDQASLSFISPLCHTVKKGLPLSYKCCCLILRCTFNFTEVQSRDSRRCLTFNLDGQRSVVFSLALSVSPNMCDT